MKQCETQPPHEPHKVFHRRLPAFYPKSAGIASKYTEKAPGCAKKPARRASLRGAVGLEWQTRN